LARLVVISNRVAVPDSEGGARAGGLEVAIRAALKRHHGIWFGWSGKVAPRKQLKTTTVKQEEVGFVVTDLTEEDYQEYYNGFANRVLWPILHYRIDLAEFSRRDLTGYLRVNEHFASELHKILRPDDIIWVHDYHLLTLAKALRERGHNNPSASFFTSPARPRKS
jgi:trehalose 6-phosphate synthase